MAPNEIDKEQEKAIDQRPNYFAGQYLLEDDFQLEQKYHIDRQRRHNRLLHVSGIAEGLKVSLGEDKKVKVSAGTAIDSQGRQIILPHAQSVELEKVANTNPLIDGEYTLSIRYKEELTEPQDSEVSMARRVQEKPKFELSKLTTPDVIPLAKLIIKGGKVENEENIDRSVRQYSGICLPTEDGKEVTLRSQRDDNSYYTQLNGGLSISGKLSVTGHTQLNNTLTVTESTIIKNNLTVKSLMVGEKETGFTLRSHGGENLNLAELAGSMLISGKLAVKNHTQLNETLTVKGNTTIEQELIIGESEKGVTLRSQRQEDQNLASLDGSLRISGTLAVTGKTTLTEDIETKGCLTAGRITAERVFVTSGFIQKDGDKAIESKNVSDLGLYSSIINSALRFVTKKGDIYFSTDGEAGEEEKVLTIHKNGDLTVAQHITAGGNITAKKFTGLFLGETKKLEITSGENGIIVKEAEEDGFIVGWIWAMKDGQRGNIKILVKNENAEELKGIAYVHNYPIGEAFIEASSTTIPVKKNEIIRVIKNDTVDPDTYGKCEWRVYWHPMGS